MIEELKVVAVRRDADDNMAEFKLNNGTVVDLPGCQKLIAEGKLDLISTTGKNGVDIVRSKPDGDPNNNLSSLPSF